MGERKVICTATPKWAEEDGRNAILWGEGRLTRGNWLAIKKVLFDYDIKTLLEFGSGLSTELFSLEPCIERLVSCDALKWHHDRMANQKLHSSVPGFKTPDVELIHYEVGNLPTFDEKFDMVFVDGPGGNRTRELVLAKELAIKVIYCHDWGRGQEEVRPDGEWEMVSLNRLFVRRKYVSTGRV